MINKKSKRGISSIIGTLLMVAVVSVIGSVILFQGLNGINNFNYYLSFLTGSKDASNESAVIEHVRFNPADNKLEVWVRNTGTVQLEISRITVVRLDTQAIIINENPPGATVFLSDTTRINHPNDGAFNWSDAGYDTAQYRISLTTSKGNSFETMATPYNT